jgi:competence protein ComEC
VRIEVLHPEASDTNSSSDANRDSLVLRLVYGRTALLLTGDILAGSEREILEECGEIRAVVLKSPHHGSRTSSSRAFLDAVSPQIVVISCGRQRQGLPAHEVLGRYLRMGAVVYRTDIHGAITVTSDGMSVSVRTAVPIPPIRTGYVP